MGGSQSVEAEQAEAAKVAESFLLAFQSHYLAIYSTAVFDRRCASGALRQQSERDWKELRRSRHGTTTTAAPTSGASFAHSSGSDFVTNNNSVAADPFSPGATQRPPEALFRKHAGASSSNYSPRSADSGALGADHDDDDDVDADGGDTIDDGMTDASVATAHGSLFEGTAASSLRQRSNTTSSSSSQVHRGGSSNNKSQQKAAADGAAASSAAMTAHSSPNLLAGMPLDIGQHCVQLNQPFDSRNWWVKRRDASHHNAILAARQRRKTSFRNSRLGELQQQQQDNDGDDDDDVVGNNKKTTAVTASTGSPPLIYPLSICPDVIDSSIASHVQVSHRYRGMLLSLSKYMKQYEARYLALRRDWHGSLWHWEEEFRGGQHPTSGRIDMSVYADGGIFDDATEAAQLRMEELAELFAIGKDAAPESELYPLRTVELFERRSSAEGEQLVLQMGARTQYWREWVQRLEQAAALACPYHVDDDVAHALAFRHAIDRAWEDVWRLYRPSSGSSAGGGSGSAPDSPDPQAGNIINNNNNNNGAAVSSSSNMHMQRSFTTTSNFLHNGDDNNNNSSDDDASDRNNKNNNNNSEQQPQQASYVFSEVPPFPRHGGGELRMLVTALYHLIRETVVVKFVFKKALEVAALTRKQTERLTERERERQEQEEAQRKRVRAEHEAMLKRKAAQEKQDGVAAVSVDSESAAAAGDNKQSPQSPTATRPSDSYYADYDDEDEAGSNASFAKRQQQQEGGGGAAGVSSASSKRRGADAEWTALKPYFDALEKVAVDVSQRGVAIGWNTTSELVKKRNVRLDCATPAELAQAAASWRRLQERSSNALGRCPFIGTVSNLLKKILSEPVVVVDAEVKSDPSLASKDEEAPELSAAAEKESITLALVRIFTGAFNRLPSAVDEVVEMSVAGGGAPSSPATTGGNGGDASSASPTSPPSAPLPNVSFSVSTRSTDSKGAAGQQAGGGGGGASGSSSTTVSTTARKGSLLYTVMSRGFPEAFHDAQNIFLSDETCAVIEALFDNLRAEFAEQASEFLVSDSKCRATVAEWAEKRAHPYLAYNSVGRALRLHSLLLTDACHTYDLLTLSAAETAAKKKAAGTSSINNNNNNNDHHHDAPQQQQQQQQHDEDSQRSPQLNRPHSFSIASRTFGDGGVALGNVKQRLEHTCVRHVRESVAQVLFSVCAVFWEGSVVRWLRRFYNNNHAHFGLSEDLCLDALEGERLDPSFAIEDGAYDELLTLCRETVSQCIADTL